MPETKLRLLAELSRARNQNSSGIKNLRRHLEGERPTQRQMILAKCCDCMAYYEDGGRDCELPTCPLYRCMPYRKK